MFLLQNILVMNEWLGMEMEDDVFLYIQISCYSLCNYPFSFFCEAKTLKSVEWPMTD